MTPSRTAGAVKIAICVATCRRPRMLRALLDSLARQALDAAPGTEPFVVVVDNDATGSARAVIDAARAHLPWPLHTDVEPDRNISRARNRAVAIALAHGADWVAFIDDDEVASAGWLAALAHVQRAHDADVVGGPVVSRYPPDAPAWLVESDLLSRTTGRTGDPIVTAATANALVSARLLAASGTPFDPDFGRAGGGDSHFFLRARLAGARMVWAAEATVTETVPPSRACVWWILRRAFRQGNAGAFVERAVLPPLGWLPRRALISVARLALGVGMLVAALARGRAAAGRALWQLCTAVGSLTGILGVRYVEYRRVHGD